MSYLYTNVLLFISNWVGCFTRWSLWSFTITLNSNLDTSPKWKQQYLFEPLESLMPEQNLRREYWWKNIHLLWSLAKHVLFSIKQPFNLNMSLDVCSDQKRENVVGNQFEAFFFVFLKYIFYPHKNLPWKKKIPSR